MIRLKVGRCAASHNPENRRDRPLSWSKDGAGHEDFHVLPNGSRKDRGKDPNSTAKGDRQGEHGHPFRMKRIWLPLPINYDSNCDNWIKSSLESVYLTGDCCSNRLRVFRNAQAFSRWPWRMSSTVDASGVVRTIPGTPWLRGKWKDPSQA